MNPDTSVSADDVESNNPVSLFLIDHEIHPAANLFPVLDGEEFNQLVASIRAHGLTHPVVLAKDGRLLDGRNRLRACETAGVDPESVIYDGDDLVEYVVRANVHRRHLTTGQRAMIATRLLSLHEAEARDRQRSHGGTAPGRPSQTLGADLPKVNGRARDQAAQMLGTSGRAVGQAKRVMKAAPDLAQQVEAGSLSLDAAHNQLRRETAKKREAEARVIKLDTVVTDAHGKGWRLLYGDFREQLAALPDGSIDAVITDPPYNAEVLDLWSDLAKHAARVLKPKGLLVALTGTMFVNQVMRRLDEHLTFGWQYVQLLPGQNSRILARHILQTWKPWLVYSSGVWPSGDIDWHEDMTDASKMSKGSFRWQQDSVPAAYVLEHLTTPGAVVLDPMVGAGTYGEAAVRLGREFIGVEADAQRFGVAVDRLNRLRSANGKGPPMT